METEQLPTLAGDFELNVDPKDRLQIPAPLRRAFEKDGSKRLWGILGYNGNLWLFGENVYSQLAGTRGPPTLEPTEEQAEYKERYFARALCLPWDKQGRINLPDKARAKYDLSREVVMVGLCDHVELYDRALWKALDTKDYQRGQERRKAVLIKAGLFPAPVGTISPTTPAEPKGDS